MSLRLQGPAANNGWWLFGRESRTSAILFTAGLTGPTWMFAGDLVLAKCGIYSSLIPELTLGLCLASCVVVIWASKVSLAVKALRASVTVLVVESLAHLPVFFVREGLAWIPLGAMTLCISGLLSARIPMALKLLWIGLSAIVMFVQGVAIVAYLGISNGLEGIH